MTKKETKPEEENTLKELIEQTRKLLSIEKYLRGEDNVV